MWDGAAARLGRGRGPKGDLGPKDSSHWLGKGLLPHFTGQQTEAREGKAPAPSLTEPMQCWRSQPTAKGTGHIQAQGHAPMAMSLEGQAPLQLHRGFLSVCL